MFLKKSVVTKNGKPYCYYKIVTSYKDENGRSKHRLVKHLGALDEAAAEEVRKSLREQKKLRAAYSEAPASPEPLGPLAAAAVLPRGIQRLVYSPFTQKEWNVADSDLLILAREGEGELYLLGRKFSLNRETALFCPPGVGMHIFNTGDRKLIVDRVSFDAIEPAAPHSGEEIAYRRRPAGWADAGEIRLSSPYHSLHLAQELFEEMTDRGTKSLLRFQSLLCELLHSLTSARPPSEEDRLLPAIERAVAYIDDNYSEDVTREQLASMAGISPEHFSRLFKDKTGTSFVKYLLRLRLTRAQELLQTSGLGVKDIAQSVGLKNEFYFSRKFKEKVGVPPAAYAAKPKVYASFQHQLTSVLLTLGIVPRLAIIEPWMAEHYAGSGLDLSGMERIAGWNEGTEARIAGLAPDLIACSSIFEPLPLLKRIAPVLPVSLEDLGWREQFLLIADIAGRRSRAERWLAEFDESTANARERLRTLLDPGDTVAIYKLVSGKIYVYGDLRSMSGPLMYQWLRLSPPPKVKTDIIDRRLLNRLVPLEELSQYDADHIFLLPYSSHWVDESTTLYRTPEWRQLRAVRKGQVYEANPDVFYGFDPLSMSLQLEETLRWFSTRSSPAHSSSTRSPERRSPSHSS
ncbi:AraC family transcriptional regulator [Cohnella fermenti]|uniref:Helix-turn-helix domain-containing protein n=1 Tax=Cohnella fermenti TaxID=2565925 RepID=A0A4S4CAZ3_9BACL|nr:AraC family transcriptional regulator [Cohnella fermenti]THF84613.1 helix-turn-helix domain-containing protein [Cohnella fermenti]